ncbi:hypothetical protein OROMI_008668 [Orobanche minor]
MLISAQVLSVSHPTTPLWSSFSRCYLNTKPKPNLKWRSMATDAGASSFSASDGPDSSNIRDSDAFCIIEGPETVQDFAKMESQEIQDNIRSRRNKIFLQMEEIKGANQPKIIWPIAQIVRVVPVVALSM